jgi:hypothetical protein
MNFKHDHDFNKVKISKQSLLETINHQRPKESSSPSFLAIEMVSQVSRVIAYQRNYNRLIHLKFIHFYQLNLAICLNRR